MGFLMTKAQSLLNLGNSQPAAFVRVCLAERRSGSEAPWNPHNGKKISAPTLTGADFPIYH